MRCPGSRLRCRRGCDWERRDTRRKKPARRKRGRSGFEPAQPALSWPKGGRQSAERPHRQRDREPGLELARRPTAGRLTLSQRHQHRVEHLLRVTEQHPRVVLEEQRILHARVPRRHAPHAMRTSTPAAAATSARPGRRPATTASRRSVTATPPVRPGASTCRSA